MKRMLTMALCAALALAALPALASEPPPMPLPEGVAYGNFGFPGLIALHGGDMAAVDAHMRGQTQAADDAQAKPLGSRQRPYPLRLGEDHVNNAKGVGDYLLAHFAQIGMFRNAGIYYVSAGARVYRVEVTDPALPQVTVIAQ